MSIRTIDCGEQHHFIGKCEFHLATFIEGWLVSTVGAWYPANGPEERCMIGLDRYYETYVFETDNDWSVETVDDEAWAHPEVTHFQEIDSLPAQTAAEASDNHRDMVDKYAAMALARS